MKRLTYLSFIVIALSLATSCATYRTNTNYTTGKVFSIEETNVSNGQLETDLEMLGEIYGSYSFDSDKTDKFNENASYVVDDNFMHRSRSSQNQINQAKSAALYNAITKANCDIILAPVYTLEVATVSGLGRSTRTTYTMTVKGFGANIKGVKQIKTVKVLNK